MKLDLFMTVIVYYQYQCSVFCMIYLSFWKPSSMGWHFSLPQPQYKYSELRLNCHGFKNVI